MTTKEYEVIVIGGGIIGSTTAYYLAQHFGQQKVLLLEKFKLLHKNGSSHGESRIIRRTYKEDHYTYLMDDAYRLWKEAEEKANRKVFTQTGGLDFCKENGLPHLSLIAASEKHNVPFQVLDAQSLKVKFPTVNLPPGFVAIYSPDSGILNATKAVSMFQTLALSAGCEIRDNFEVTKVEKLGNLLKITGNGGETFFTKKCCIVAGAWAGKLLKNCFNLELSLKPVQTTVAYWKVDDPGAYSAEKFPIFICYDELLAYGTPILEYPGLIKCCPHGGVDCDPDNRDFQPNHELIETNVKLFLQRFFSGVDLSAKSTESCIVTYTPDHDFIIDKLPGIDNILIGCGFSGHGFKLAPVVGKIMADLTITGRHPYPAVQKFFELSRFDKII